MWVGRTLSVTVVALLSCMRPASGDPARRDSAPLPLLTRTVGPSVAPSVLAARPWVEALRMERWSEAVQLLAAEQEPLRNDPLVRYASAVAAEHVGDYAASLRLLSELESALPELTDRIRWHRAEAAFRAGDFALALAYFQTRSEPLARLRTAEAESKLGNAKAARATLESLLTRLPPRTTPCAIQAPARKLLAQVLPADAAALRAREYRWLAVQAPTCDASEEADAQLEAFAVPHRLTSVERLSRARSFADAGRVERLERELELIGRAPLGPFEPGTPDFLRGYARFQARRELEYAAALMSSAAVANPGHAAEWLFYAARAREREAAIEPATALFERVRRTYPRTPFAEFAEYRLAQLAYSSGHFQAAAKAYDDYLRRFGVRARFASDAKDERAVAWLLSGRPSAAAKEFEKLADNARDRRARARYAELEAVALSKAGRVEPARSLFLQIVREHPLSFAALCAAARLSAIGVGSASPSSNPLSPASSAAWPQASPAAMPVNSAPYPALTAVTPLTPLSFPLPVELLHGLGLDREAEIALEAFEPQIARTQARGSEALCSLYGRLAPAERGYRVGQRAASSDELAAFPTPDRRWLWECVYPRPYASLVNAFAREQGVEPELLYAVMRQESSFRPDAVSPARAVGLLQLLPETASRVAEELQLPFDAAHLNDPPLNLRLGARYLKKLLDLFGGSEPVAVAAYNAGPAAVLRWLENGSALELDIFVARIPYEETRNYVERVIGNHARYRYLSSANGATPQLVLELPRAKTEVTQLY